MVSVPIFPPKAIAFFRTDSVFSSLQPVVYPAGKHATAVGRACFLTGGMVPGVAEWGVVLGGCFGSMFSSLRSAGGLLRLGEHPQPSSPLASPCQARPCGRTSSSRERGFEDCGAWKERSLWSAASAPKGRRRRFGSHSLACPVGVAAPPYSIQSGVGAPMNRGSAPALQRLSPSPLLLTGRGFPRPGRGR